MSAQVGSQLYVGLGSAGQQWYRLDLNQKSKGWQAVSHFSGPSRDGATATAIGKNIYVFGGSGKAKAQDKSPIIFDTIYRYQVDLDKWEEMDAHTPVGLLGASSYSPNGEEILFSVVITKHISINTLHQLLLLIKRLNPKNGNR